MYTVYMYIYVFLCAQHISSIFQQFASPVTSNVPHLRKAITQDAHHSGRLTKCVTGMCHLLLRPQWNLQRKSLHLVCYGSDLLTLSWEGCNESQLQSCDVKEDGSYCSKRKYIEYSWVLVTVLMPSQGSQEAGILNIAGFSSPFL